MAPTKETSVSNEELYRLMEMNAARLETIKYLIESWKMAPREEAHANNEMLLNMMEMNAMLLGTIKNLTESRAHESSAAKINKAIMRHQPSEYDGTGGPVRLDEWFREMEKIFSAVGCPAELMVDQAAFYLDKQAGLWWYDNKDVLILSHNKEVFGWESFKKAMRENFGDLPEIGSNLPKKRSSSEHLAQTQFSGGSNFWPNQGGRGFDGGGGSSGSNQSYKERVRTLFCFTGSTEIMTAKKSGNCLIALYSGILTCKLISCTIEFDGASKGNPGLSGAGAILRVAGGSEVWRLREGVGIATNNVAEYRSLILGLRTALQKGFKHVRVTGDSLLVCNQIQGIWKTKNENMANLCKTALILKKQFASFTIEHVPREFNSDADGLANRAINLLDGQVEMEVTR